MKSEECKEMNPIISHIFTYIFNYLKHSSDYKPKDMRYKEIFVYFPCESSLNSTNQL